MSDKLEILEQQLRQLEKIKQQNIQESNDLLNNNPEVKRFVRLSYEGRKLDKDMLELKEAIKYETMIECHHRFINVDSIGNQYCIKCGLSTELKKSGMEECLKNRKIYEQTLDNSEVINTDYVCKKEVVMKICSYIVEQYPYISDDKLVHFIAVAIHNMQTKKKSDNVKRDRAKRLYIRPSFLEKSNML